MRGGRGIVSTAIGTGTLFVLLGVVIARHGAAVPAIDDNLHAWVIAHRDGFDTSFARAITNGGATAVTLPTLVVVGALAPRGPREPGTRIRAGILLAGLASVGVYVGLALNSWIGRIRPPVADWAAAAGGPAFPSGHTTAATLFALSCGWALSGRIRPGWSRVALWAAAGTYAFAVGWSRVWLGVHWPTDVVGGWLYAVTWSCCIWALAAGVRRHWPRPAPSGN
jgi:undecaprenyl-diphosphatase